MKEGLSVLQLVLLRYHNGYIRTQLWRRQQAFHLPQGPVLVPFLAKRKKSLSTAGNCFCHFSQALNANQTVLL